MLTPRAVSSIKLAAKITISVASIYIVLRNVSVEELINKLMDVKLGWVLLALLVFTAAQFISALRCVYIARTLGGKLGLNVSVEAHFIGLWFNQVLPTSLGGDVVKVAILKNNLGLSLAVRSAILDRVSGLVFLLVSMVVLLPAYANMFNNPLLTVLIGVFAGGSILTMLIVARFSEVLSLKLSFLPGLSHALHLFANIWQFRKGRPLIDQVWTSFIVHVNGIIAYALIGKSMGLDQSILVYLLLTPLVFLVALIPISFAGWGLREIGAVWLFGLVGIAPEKAMSMSIIFGLMLIIGGLPGIALLLRNNRRHSNVLN